MATRLTQGHMLVSFYSISSVYLLEYKPSDMSGVLWVQRGAKWLNSWQDAQKLRLWDLMEFWVFTGAVFKPFWRFSLSISRNEPTKLSMLKINLTAGKLKKKKNFKSKFNWLLQKIVLWTNLTGVAGCAARKPKMGYQSWLQISSRLRHAAYCMAVLIILICHANTLWCGPCVEQENSDIIWGETERNFYPTLCAHKKVKCTIHNHTNHTQCSFRILCKLKVIIIVILEEFF